MHFPPSVLTAYTAGSRHLITFSVTAVECERLPLTLVMVMVKVPNGDRLLVAKLKVDVAEPLEGWGR